MIKLSLEIGLILSSLLFYADFDNSFDAVFSVGEGKALIEVDQYEPFITVGNGGKFGEAADGLGEASEGVTLVAGAEDEEAVGGRFLEGVLDDDAGDVAAVAGVILGDCVATDEVVSEERGSGRGLELIREVGAQEVGCGKCLGEEWVAGVDAAVDDGDEGEIGEGCGRFRGWILGWRCGGCC